MTRPDSATKYHMYTRYAAVYVSPCIYAFEPVVYSNSGEINLLHHPSIISVSTISITDEDRSLW